MKQALKMAMAALREARVDVEEAMHNCAAALAGTEKGARRVEAYRQQLAEIDAAIRDAEAALAQPKPEPEPVAWQHRRPLCGSDGYELGYGDWEDGRGLDHWPHRALYASAAPTQAAELAAVTAACREHARTSGALVNKLYNYSPNLSDSVAAGQWMQTAAQLLTVHVPDTAQSAELAAVTAERDGLLQHARDSAELRRLCAERDQLRAEVERLRAERVPLKDALILRLMRDSQDHSARIYGLEWPVIFSRLIERCCAEAWGITLAASTT